MENIENNSNMEVQEQTAGTKVLIAISKKSGSQRLLVDSMEGYEDYKVDGIAVKDNGKGVIMSLSEQLIAFGGTSKDMAEDDERRDIPSPSMTTLDGESRTSFLIGWYDFKSGALVESLKYGWTPSGGEWALILSVKDKVNEKLQAVNATLLAGDYYHTSQRFDNDYMWHLNLEDGVFGVWKGMEDELILRPVKSIEGYEDVTESTEE